MAGHIFAIDGGLARYYGNESRKLNYVYVSKNALENPAVSGLSQKDLAKDLRKLLWTFKTV